MTSQSDRGVRIPLWLAYTLAALIALAAILAGLYAGMIVFIAFGVFVLAGLVWMILAAESAKARGGINFEDRGFDLSVMFRHSSSLASVVLALLLIGVVVIGVLEANGTIGMSPVF